MNILIVEDEQLAREYLMGLLDQLSIPLNVVGEADSVKEAIKWLLKNKEPELIFMDIDLGDGLCFEIFEVIDVKCPVIFTTAYDEYAIKAFKVNSIDYLLKPMDKDDVECSLLKFKSIKDYHGSQILYKDLNKSFSKGFKERFIVKIGDHLKTIPTEKILFFISEHKSTFVITSDGRKYPIDYSLDKLNELLDPKAFFRANRKYLLKYQAITEIVSFSNSRLKVSLINGDDEDIIVSRDRVLEFKQWLDK